jgi:glutathione peroxidase-family protein
MHLGAHRPVQMEVIDLLIGVLSDADSQKILFVRDGPYNFTKWLVSTKQKHLSMFKSRVTPMGKGVRLISTK